MRIKTLVASVAILSPVAVTLAVPVVEGDSVSLSHPDGMGKALIAYELKNDPAVITIGIETNALADGSGAWTALTDAETRWMSGDVNQLVATGLHEVVWMPTRSCPAFVATAPAARAVVKVWPTDSPPDIMVVDLEVASNVWFHTSIAALPETEAGYDIYKTDRIVLRRIPAAQAVFTMGASAVDSTAANVLAHEVTLTNDFYMGIYEVTARQYKDIDEPTTYKSCQDAYKPRNWVSYEMIRGTKAEADWPNDGREKVGASSWLKKIRDKTGVLFDLPTEAEWEFACRAGVGGPYNVEGMSTKDIGWFRWSMPDGTDPTSEQPVATKSVNAWGLYDMHGNVQEWCLDWYASEWPDGSSPVAAPVGPTSGSTRVLRGGAWSANGGNQGRSFNRDMQDPVSHSTTWSGFRLWAPCAAR